MMPPKHTHRYDGMDLARGWLGVVGLAAMVGLVLAASPVRAQESGDETSTSSEASGPREGGTAPSVDPTAPSPNGGETPDEESASDAEEGSEDEGSSDDETSSGSAETERPDGMPAAPDVPDEFSDRRAEELKEFRTAYRRYAREIEDYQGTIDAIVDAEYQKRRSKLNEEFNRKAERLEALERKRRNAAVERFKRFLEKHPDHPKYTPDAMFRLAELYFEQENDQFLQADERYRREMKRYRAGRRPSPPEAPRRDYSNTIDTFSKLVRQWPDYRLLDGAYYLLAYCEQKMGNPRKARDLFAELVVKRPRSEFVPEAWIRIGEYHFDRSDDPKEIALAKNAYEQAMKQSKFYDKALYKLAWSYYRLDRFDDAIRHFEQLVEYSDRQKRKTGEEGSVLRAEAVKYIAVSLAEEDWDLDRKVDDNFGLARIEAYLGEGKPYEREVLVKLVGRRQEGTKQGYLLQNNHYEEATRIIQYALDQYPKHPENPRLHKQLILALTKADKVDRAFAERRKLIDLYGPDSEWYAYQKQQGNEAAIERGDDLVRENLIQAAKWYHQQAQQLKDKAKVKQSEQLLARSRQKYQRAAEAYERYLKRYPNDRDIYRWNFYYADTLYYSGQYRQAYEQYRVVRELDLDNNKFQGKAAYSAVKALEFQLKKLADQGELPSNVVPSGSRKEARQTARKQQKNPEQGASQPQQSGGGESSGIEPEPIPALVEKYVTAMDRFVVLGLDYKEDQETQSKFAFNAAKIYYDFRHFDTARNRFKWIVDAYPDREVGFLAGSLLLETYRLEKNYDKMATWADKLSGILKGEQAKAVKEEVQQHRLGALFKSAETLFDNEKYEKAAEKYMKLVDQAPDYENAPLALNNAAVAYEEVKKYQSAMKIYERVYREYPEHPLAGYALYRVGVNSERFFEFDKALQSYKLFFDKYQNEETPEELARMNFTLEEKLPKALLSSAVLSMNLQNYRDAAGLYQQFVETYPDNKQAAQAQWQIVESWRKAENKEKMVEAIRTYKDKFGDNPDNSKRVLEGMMRIAEWHEEKEESEKAKKMYETILEEFKKRKVSPGSDSAYYPAKAQFELAERKYAKWREIKIEGSLQEQKENLDKKVKEQKKVASAFQKVWQYQNLEWTLAAGFRVGSLFQGFAEALYAVPIPFKPGTQQYRIYRKQLEDIAIPLEDKAVERYEKTIKKAREEKIVNKWTKKTLEQLNKYRPQQYPLYKEERQARETRALTGRSLMAAPPSKSSTSSKNNGDTSDDDPSTSETSQMGSGDSNDEASDSENSSEGASAAEGDATSNAGSSGSENTEGSGTTSSDSSGASSTSDTPSK